MLHTINCVQNAIQCARENLRDANIHTTTRMIYIVANDYIDESTITCTCVYEYSSIIENELRDLYRESHFINFQIKSHYVEQFDVYHVAYSTTYDDNSIAFESMIVKFNYFQNSRSSFRNFDMINEIDIY